MLDMERLFEDAKKGVLPALKLLGDLYIEGNEENGVEADLEQAIAYYTQAAEGGMEEAWLELGYIYCAGEYMEPDYEKGLACYERAAEMGNTTAMGNLGMSYCKGLGVEKDDFRTALGTVYRVHGDEVRQIGSGYDHQYTYFRLAERLRRFFSAVEGIDHAGIDHFALRHCRLKTFCGAVKVVSDLIFKRRIHAPILKISETEHTDAEFFLRQCRGEDIAENSSVFSIKTGYLNFFIHLLSVP